MNEDKSPYIIGIFLTALFMMLSLVITLYKVQKGFNEMSALITEATPRTENIDIEYSDKQVCGLKVVICDGE